MSQVEELRARRTDYSAKARALADRVQGQKRGFTPDEQKEAARLVDGAKQTDDEIKRIESVTATSEEVGDLLAAEEARVAGRARPKSGRASRLPHAPLAGSFARALFGGSEQVSTGRKQDLTAMGERDRLDLTGVPSVSPLTAASGRVAALMPADGDSSVFGLPERNAQVLQLLTPFVTHEGTGPEYSFYRQTERDKDGAAFVARHGDKPEVGFSYERVKDKVRTIAAVSEPIARQDIVDLEGLHFDISYELARRVVYRIEDAVLNGEADDDDDEGPFDGILNTTGVQQQDFADSPADTIRSAITRLEADGVNVGSIVMHPKDWQRVETARDADGRPLYAAALYTDRQKPVLFGHPVVVSSKMPTGTAVLGDWTSPTMFVREDIELAWSDGGELLAKNEIRFRAEARVGFNILQPSALVVADLDNDS